MMPTPHLTRQQWLVWACYVSGMSRAQVAESLGIGTETVKTHIERIHEKLKTTGLGRLAFETTVTHD
jgi:DNA-binding CsgD family transcriptional regulator